MCWRKRLFKHSRRRWATDWTMRRSPFYCAGQARTSNFSNTSDQDWRDEFELKFFSVLRPVRAFIDMLEGSGAGAIVCTSAMLARSPEPFLIATGATRAGQLNLLKSLSKGAQKYSCNAVLMDWRSGRWVGVLKVVGTGW